MNKQDEQRTERLRALVNDSPITSNITEDAQFIYFDTDDIMPAMLLRQEHYEITYQENLATMNYRVRVLKPNWFSHDLEEEKLC